VGFWRSLTQTSASCRHRRAEQRVPVSRCALLVRRYPALSHQVVQAGLSLCTLRMRLPIEAQLRHHEGTDIRSSGEKTWSIA
jgi:hypothetical protein